MNRYEVIHEFLNFRDVENKENVAKECLTNKINELIEMGYEKVDENHIKYTNRNGSYTFDADDIRRNTLAWFEIQINSYRN